MLSFIYKFLIFPIILITALAASFVSFQILHIWIRFDLIAIAVIVLAYGIPANYLMIFLLGIAGDIVNVLPLGTTSLLWIIFTAFWIKISAQNFCIFCLKSISYFAAALTVYSFVQSLMVFALHGRIEMQHVSVSILATIVIYNIVCLLLSKKSDKT